jgi:spore germination protein GerM
MMKINKEILKKNPLFLVIIIIAIISAIVLVVLRLNEKDIEDLANNPNSLYNFQRSTSDLSQREVTLYFSSDEDSYLHPEKRPIYDTESVTDQAKQVVVELIKGPKSKLRATIPEGTKLRELFIDKYGTGYVDLTSEVVNNMRGGSEAEMLLVYSIVNTLTENFTEMKRIRFLVDGREIETLNGHLDLIVSFVNRPDMVVNPDMINTSSSTPETGESDNE